MLEKSARIVPLQNHAGNIDLAIIIDVYHHIEYPRTVLRQIRSALKPGGKLLVLDFIRDPEIHKSHPPSWILQHVRADQNTFRNEILSTGFTLVNEPVLPDLLENYIMVFEPVNLLETTCVGTGWAQRS